MRQGNRSKEKRATSLGSWQAARDQRRFYAGKAIAKDCLARQRRGARKFAFVPASPKLAGPRRQAFQRTAKALENNSYEVPTLVLVSNFLPAFYKAVEVVHKTPNI